MSPSPARWRSAARALLTGALSFQNDTLDLINLGTIAASGGTLDVAALSLVNDGLMQVTTGAVLALGTIAQSYDGTTGAEISSATTFSNAGTIRLDGGTLSLQVDATDAGLGAIANTGGTLIYAGGTLDNTGATLNAASTSLLGLELAGGTIEGGTLDSTALSFTVQGSYYAPQGDLDNVAIRDNLSVFGAVAVSGSTTIAADASGTRPGSIDIGAFGSVGFIGAGQLTLEDSVVLAGGQLGWGLDFAGTAGTIAATIDTGASVSGTGVVSGDLPDQDATIELTNLGTIDADVGGNDLSLDVAGIVNAGLIEAQAGGVLVLGELGEVYDPTTGTEIGTATSFVDSGTVSVDDATLVLDVDASAAQLGDIENVGGVVILGGTLENAGRHAGRDRRGLARPAAAGRHHRRRRDRRGRAGPGGLLRHHRRRSDHQRAEPGSRLAGADRQQRRLCR